MCNYDPASPDACCYPETMEQWNQPTSRPGGLPVGPVVPGPIPPPILRKRPVSGRYRSSGAPWILELRVDVDRTRPMNRVSGDFYQVSGATVSYFGSFVVSSPTVSVSTTTVTITGTGSYSYGTSYPVMQVVISRTTIFQPMANATLTFFSTGGAKGATYVCAFESIYFRSVQLEQDNEQGVTPFSSYNTGSLPAGGAARTLSVAGAYAEAGVEMVAAGTTDTIPTAEAGTNLKWSDSELHASMVKHFSLWHDIPQWKAWLFHAYEHENPGLLGIMFDQQGKQRQGAATFYKGLGGATAQKQRLQLFAAVHELGHTFNLLHSFGKSDAVPAVANRPNALSWMNYPHLYPPGGEPAFWNAFGFIFDDPEVVHLRHAYRNAIIMGGNNFTVGSALEALQNEQAFAQPLMDQSGLKLALEAPASFLFGEPVVVEIKLKATDLSGRMAHAQLHPSLGYVRIGIRKPNGQVVAYEPLIEHCDFSPPVKLDASRPTVYESAYIGFGKGGFYFDQPGFYHLRATYRAPDGSEIVSDTLTLRVRSPHAAADEEVADLFFGNEQGTLLSLLGSDADELRAGNDAFDLVIDKHGKHKLAVYARLVRGINAGRAFKTITADKKLTVRKPEADQSARLLTAVADASEAGVGVDNITLNQSFRALIKAYRTAGKEKNAKDTRDRMVDTFTKKGLKPAVLQQITAEADAALEE
ncbi:hypothetical protein [Geobacter grbiciae]|uniref:hypothetical protein n=1 Tax=Geobacter grbiciae TaxID=155042 RepID=UPI001C025C8A|nr:hypothetical protein [Geobacter grbiciae]MBT1076899.1 hypothetical protein [Geobacter grbiciae]